MARETKVGLIAGLAFIICFAVILANRGQKAKLTTHRPYLVDRGVDPSPNLEVSDDEPRRVQPRRSASGRRTASGDRSPAVMPASGAQVIFDQSDASRQRRVADPTPPSGTAIRAQHAPTRLAPEGGPAKANVDVDTSRVLTSRDAGEQRRRLLQEQLDALSARTAADRQTGRSGPPRVSSEDGSPPPNPARADGRATPTRVDRPRARHTVVAGENLSKIAQAYYGTKSRRVVEAIFRANRTALSSPDIVHVGVDLVLPSIEGADVMPAARDTRERSLTTQRQSTPSQAGFRWYQIRKNDRYASIARQELNDEGRWPEIFELNKDKFPDPQMIREGVRIKLPTATVADAAGERR